MTNIRRNPRKAAVMTEQHITKCVSSTDCIFLINQMGPFYYIPDGGNSKSYAATDKAPTENLRVTDYSVGGEDE